SPEPSRAQRAPKPTRAQRSPDSQLWSVVQASPTPPSPAVTHTWPTQTNPLSHSPDAMQRSPASLVPDNWHASSSQTNPERHACSEQSSPTPRPAGATPPVPALPLVPPPPVGAPAAPAAEPPSPPLPPVPVEERSSSSAVVTEPSLHAHTNAGARNAQGSQRSRVMMKPSFWVEVV